MLLLPWLLVLQMHLCRLVMRTRDPQAADAIANYGLSLIFFLPLLPTYVLLLVSPALYRQLLAGVLAFLESWPLLLGLSWLALALWLVQLGREGRTA